MPKLNQRARPSRSIPDAKKQKTTHEVVTPSVVALPTQDAVLPTVDTSTVLVGDIKTPTPPGPSKKVLLRTESLQSEEGDSQGSLDEFIVSEDDASVASDGPDSDSSVEIDEGSSESETYAESEGEEDYCTRCGRDSHVRSECYARYTEEGSPVYSD